MLKASMEVVASHHTEVVAFWDAAAEVVTTTQYFVVIETGIRLRICRSMRNVLCVWNSR
jgi:hypothetical protein